MSNSNILLFAKMTVDQGRYVGYDKGDFHRAIEKRAAEIRRPGETSEQSYSRVLETNDGRLLFAAYKIAPPGAAPNDSAPAVASKGAAEKEMQAAVENHRAASAAQGLSLSPEQAFTAVYTDPANVDLKKRFDAEDFAKCARAG
jgi:hypothetical protein